MKALLAALLFAFCLLCPCAHAQQDEAARSRFLAVEAKAKQGDARAQYSLGVCYYDGYGVEKYFVEAVYWYRKAASQGHAAAQHNLGVCYNKGEGVEKDFVEAVKWFRKGAEQGDADNQIMLGVSYYFGNGVEQNLMIAKAWWRRSNADKNAAERRSDLEAYMSPQQVVAAQKRRKELRAIVEAKAAK